MDSILFSLSTCFCSLLAVFVHIQGCIICLVLAIGWPFATCVREIKRMRDSMRHVNSFTFLCHDINELEHSRQVNLPRVSAVMPLKGFGEHNLYNWRSQITSLYGWPLEFLFVVESTEDPAYHAVSMLISDYEVGVEKMHKDSKYVLFLDDDVRLHLGSIGALTAEMEKQPEPCSMGFATGGKTFFLWGGCMMMHADDFRCDRFGVVSGLRDGGYSNHMTLAAIAVFPHPLASDLSFSRYWNYLRKQTFFLGVYTSKVRRLMAE